MNGQPQNRRGRLFGRIGSRILAGMLLAALAPLIVAAYQGYHCARQALVEEVQNRLLAIARGRRDRIQSWLTERMNDAVLLCVTPCLWDKRIRHDGAGAQESVDGACSCLESFMQHSVYYQGIGVLDGPDRFAAKDGVFPGKAGGTGFWEQLIKSRGPVQSPLIRTPSGQLVLLVGGRLEGDAKSPRYVVVSIDASRFLSEILDDTSGLGGSGKVRLASEDGYLLSLRCEGKSRDLHVREEASDGLREALGHHRPLARYENEHGAEVIAAHVRIPELDCILVMEMETREALRWLRILKLRALLMGVITFAVAYAGARGLAKRLADPLAHLAQAARRVGREGLDQAVPVEGEDEVVEVAEALNQMREDLKASQDAVTRSAALAAVGELSASVVHEMRNPLSSVKMNIQAIKKKVEDDPLHRELMEIAFGQVDRIERMLTDLLDFGKPLALAIARQPIRLAIEDALQICEPVAQAKGVALAARLDADLPDVDVDRERLAQAIVNLINNAIEAGDPGSTVHVGLGPEEAGAVSEVAIVVRDEGAGIADEALPQLFTPFFTTKRGGTGLGLANVRKIVDLHRGRVVAENHPMGGAQFTVYLPAKGGS